MPCNTNKHPKYANIFYTHQVQRNYASKTRSANEVFSAFSEVPEENEIQMEI